jgi:hypothetical protein
LDGKLTADDKGKEMTIRKIGLKWSLAVATAFCFVGNAAAGEKSVKTPCEISGYEVGSPEYRVCSTLLTLYPPSKNTRAIQAVHRFSTENIDGYSVYCSLEGGIGNPVSCDSQPLIQVSQKWIEDQKWLQECTGAIEYLKHLYRDQIPAQAIVRVRRLCAKNISPSE